VDRVEGLGARGKRRIKIKGKEVNKKERDKKKKRTKKHLSTHPP
jgi:hypothetical protein